MDVDPFHERGEDARTLCEAENPLTPPPGPCWTLHIGGQATIKTVTTNPADWTHAEKKVTEKNDQLAAGCRVLCQMFAVACELWCQRRRFRGPLQSADHTYSCSWGLCSGCCVF